VAVRVEVPFRHPLSSRITRRPLANIHRPLANIHRRLGSIRRRLGSTRRPRGNTGNTRLRTWIPPRRSAVTQ
jgi:hypothetical protein